VSGEGVVGMDNVGEGGGEVGVRGGGGGGDGGRVEEVGGEWVVPS